MWLAVSFVKTGPKWVQQALAQKYFDANGVQETNKYLCVCLCVLCLFDVNIHITNIVSRAPVDGATIRVVHPASLAKVTTRTYSSPTVVRCTCTTT